ncbi:MAG: dienelactone hydrolase family protein [Myxococcota bacterium]|nr:dienelactone hydrolase family protein [Myxococcota bacterium]
MSVTTQSVDIPLPEGGTMKGYLARPEGQDTLPGVLVFMEIFGINAHIRDVTERVASEGFVALAPDYFHRTGAGMELNYDDAGMAEGMSHLGQLKADQMISDARAAKDFLEARGDTGGAGVGAIGFCIGGHMTYLAASEVGLKAAASYYGGGIAAPAGPGGGASTLSRTPGISGRIECYFGKKDSMIPQDQVEAVRGALESAGTPHSVHVYDEADHGFNCDQRDSFHPESAQDAWGRSMALFNSELRD